MSDASSSKTRLALLEECVALLWDAQDMMNDGPDDSDKAYAQGKLAEACELARQIHRLPHETTPALGDGHVVFCDHCDASVLLPYTDATKSAIAVAPMEGWDISSHLSVMCPKCRADKTSV